MEGDVPVVTPAQGAPPFLFYNPSLSHVASCESQISHIEGATGLLKYRGNLVEDYVSSARFEEVASLLSFGNDVNEGVRPRWERLAISSMSICKELTAILNSLPIKLDPLNAMSIGIAALPETRAFLHFKQNASFQDEDVSAFLLGRTAAIFAFWRCRILGLVWPETAKLACNSSFGGMLARLLVSQKQSSKFTGISSLIDQLLILHAEHEQNCSTFVVRTAASSQCDAFMAVVAGISAFKGSLHGGASVAVAEMYTEIRKQGGVEAFIRTKMAKRERIMGFGHRVYRTWDPRARFMRDLIQAMEPISEEVSAARDAALVLIDILAKNTFFQERKLFPNPDLLNGILFSQLGIPNQMNTAALVVGRMAGWLAHYREQRLQNTAITRPRQVTKHL